ncbi:hypothetical protein [Streptomyces sp. 8N706]|uniref:hypothetical protein n=1 Tax=Streptomyces sp. 8N706 TaxID=3457416 RepID=UPI003FCFCEFE
MSMGELRDGQHRILAVLILLDRLYQVLKGFGRTAEVSNQVGGRPSGRPPAGGECPDGTSGAGDSQDTPFARGGPAVEELALLLCRWKASTSTGRTARRIAELWEYLDEVGSAYRWWQVAAAMGDSDAQEYLEVLHGEVQHGTDWLAVVNIADVGPPCSWSEWTCLSDAARSACGGLVAPAVEEAEVRQMVRQIEDYLTHPDQVANGGRQR